MKRRLAPSAVYENKKLKGDEEYLSLQIPAPPLPTAATIKKGPGRKKVVNEPVINHLERYKPIKKEEPVSNETSTTTTGNGVIKFKEETKVGRNVRLTPDSTPLYFIITFKSTNKADDEAAVGDGIIQVSYDKVLVLSTDGRQIGKAGLTRKDADDDEKKQHQRVFIKNKEVYFQEEFSMMIGNKFVKVIYPFEEEEFKNGTIFLKTEAIIQKKKQEKKEKKKTLLLAAARKPKGWEVPVKGVEKQVRLTKPLHNPYAPNSLVLFMPTNLTNAMQIPVVVDPILSAKLRPHQREGVQFMFDCLHGLKGGYKGNGCILADDMGLGKSIQAITILWTCLKQGPTGDPTSKKAIIVAPTSLVGNWKNELKKWLGDGISPVAIGESTKTGLSKLSELQYGKADVLIISYDQLRIYCEDICKIPTIGLIICDEGHRLKNAEIKTTKAVSMIPTPLRIILSGTPIQNDLTEFYAMVNFVNPGVLKNVTTFKNVYDVPIVASRNPDASDEEKRIGRERSLELTRITSQFILRRTAVVNTQYLPQKIEYVVLCKLSTLQLSIYKHLLQTIKDNSSFSSVSGALPLITTLKKLSNCAELVYLPDKENPTEINKSILKLFPKEWNPKVFQPQYSSKLLFTDRLLNEIRTKTKDRVVIISNYTQTLDVLGIMCKSRGYEYFKLDGSLKSSKRQELVDKFNDPTTPQFVFLLSSKAGGVGLNLIGGNHLILFDSDWNPANDAQAMARVWREGQKKVVSIYRTLTTGTIEEKIFQRQLTKQALSVSITEGDSENSPAFDSKDLKDIFTLREDTICDTHDMLSCKCAPSSRIPKHKRDTLSINELNKWKHFHDVSKIEDPKVALACKDLATFVFVNDKGPSLSGASTNKQLESNNGNTDSPTNQVAISQDKLLKSKSRSNKGLDVDDDDDENDGYSDEEQESDNSYESDSD
ncbi:hypothetical protein CYY_000160 [Polysphondylium violaceum]|uniref:SNF2-related domain-containing protein n=1 Tax=Polysphondylium violaceum TaxID=133409 RepID=A0A8J4Q4C0_9MYCE|nr:hypothetical protein CYY_000160 [Polysphondylium violaceum]